MLSRRPETDGTQQQAAPVSHSLSELTAGFSLFFRPFTSNSFQKPTAGSDFLAFGKSWVSLRLQNYQIPSRPFFFFILKRSLTEASGSAFQTFKNLVFSSRPCGGGTTSARFWLLGPTLPTMVSSPQSRIYVIGFKPFSQFSSYSCCPAVSSAPTEHLRPVKRCEQGYYPDAGLPAASNPPMSSLIIWLSIQSGDGDTTDGLTGVRGLCVMTPQLRW